MEAYRGVLEAFPGKKVVVRTLDAGADKPLPFLTDATEANPALGVRAYHTARRDPIYSRAFFNVLLIGLIFVTAISLLRLL